MVQSGQSQINDGNWYLLRCQIGKEIFAARTLRDHRGLEVFLPEYTIRSRGETRRLPFFPGYMFIQADLQQTTRGQIHATPGVLYLVSFGEAPYPIPPHVIEEITHRLHSLEATPPVTFHLGDCVRFKKQNSLQDLEMIFAGPTTPSQRVYVLLNFLGRLKQVQVDVNTIEKAPCQNPVSPLHSLRERYTRGKGRKIKQVCERTEF